MRRILVLISAVFILSPGAQAASYSWANRYFPEFRLKPQHFGSMMMVKRDPGETQYSVRGGSYDGLYTADENYFQPYFGSVYRSFSALRYEFPQGHVFCRMENECTKRYGFMLSIHAGGYSER